MYNIRNEVESIQKQTPPQLTALVRINKDLHLSQAYPLELIVHFPDKFISLDWTHPEAKRTHESREITMEFSSRNDTRIQIITDSVNEVDSARTISHRLFSADTTDFKRDYSNSPESLHSVVSPVRTSASSKTGSRPSNNYTDQRIQDKTSIGNV